MSFVYPYLLVLMWIVPVALWWIFRIHSRRQALWSAWTVTRPATGQRHTRFYAQFMLLGLGLFLCIIAVARPRWGEQEQRVLSKGRNIVIAVDVSRSMLAEDVRPNRLERARADIRDLLADLQGDRVALMAFRGSATLIVPLTTDKAFLRHALDALSPDSAPRGETDIGAAIHHALDALLPFDGDHNAIILISDGEDLAKTAAAAANTARERDIPIFTVGIGDPQGATIPVTAGQPMQYQGETVTTRLDNQTLAEIATLSGGKYIPLQTASTGPNSLGTLYKKYLSDRSRQDDMEHTERRKVERYQLFLIPGILAFLGVALLSLGRSATRINQ